MTAPVRFPVVKSKVPVLTATVVALASFETVNVWLFTSIVPKPATVPEMLAKSKLLPNVKSLAPPAKLPPIVGLVSVKVKVLLLPNVTLPVTLLATDKFKVLVPLTVNAPAKLPAPVTAKLPPVAKVTFEIVKASSKVNVLAPTANVALPKFANPVVLPVLKLDPNVKVYAPPPASTFPVISGVVYEPKLIVELPNNTKSPVKLFLSSR